MAEKSNMADIPEIPLISQKCSKDFQILKYNNFKKFNMAEQSKMVQAKFYLYHFLTDMIDQIHF
jgi:hypothetical protein